MCTFCRLLHEFHNLRAQDKPGWGRANSHTNFGNSHANCVGVPNANNNSNEFPNKLAFWNSKREGMAVTLQSQWGFRSYLKYPTGNSNMNWNKPKDPGVISVDRSTKATLSTYNTWVERSRLQSVYKLPRTFCCLCHRSLLWLCGWTQFTKY